MVARPVAAIWPAVDSSYYGLQAPGSIEAPGRLGNHTPRVMVSQLGWSLNSGDLGKVVEGIARRPAD
jgi:hypothetical protein